MQTKELRQEMESCILYIGCSKKLEPLPPPVDIQTSCDLVVWRNAPNISDDHISGYEIRLVNQAADNLSVIINLDASETFYSLDNLNEYKSELTLIQVSYTISNLHACNHF